MIEVRTAHTAELDAATLAATRALLDEAFDGNFSDQDWDHTLGGVHALAWEDGSLVGHGAVVQRRLLYDGRAVRTGYVEGVGVRADRRGRGYGAAVMAALERVLTAAYELGALSSTGPATGLYLARGWRRWEGSTWALTPDGVVRTTEDDGGVFVLPVSGVWDVSRPLTCDWRDGDLW